MDVLDYNQLRKEFAQRKKEARQPWKKAKKEEPAQRSEEEQNKQDFWEYLVTNTVPVAG